ncbi:reverse transcriptase domain-containing protein [Tanacetum coccineum]|uniref:Cytochrome c oxidase polypeptide II n=1 Tax=Tanacetum coccineum TaxID=301880 RepID=A0ABQ5DXJ6_9ASTR
MNVSITLSIGRIEHEGKADGWDLILVSLISRRKDTDLGKANVRSMYPSGVGKGLKPRIRLTNRWLSMKKDQATVAVVKYSNVFASGEFEYQSLQLTSVVVGYAGDLVLWAVPSSGVKCDAVPGRLNQISISVQREGVYYDRPTAEPTLAQPHHPGCEPPEKQAITASGWSSMEPRSKAVDKIEEGVRLPVEQRIRSCEGGQSKIVLFLYKDNRRSQRLGATLFLSYSSFFMISCRGEQTKQKRGPSQRKEKDLQRQRLLTLFLFLVVFYESGKPPQRDPQNIIEKGGQGSRKSLSLFPVKIDGKEPYQGHKQMSTPMFVDPDISTQADGAQSPRVPVPFAEDPYEAIRQAYLVGTNTESEPFEDPVETETPESPHTVASPTPLLDSTPLTRHAEDPVDSDTSSARPTPSDFTAPLSPDHPLTYASPTLVSFIRRTACMAVLVPPAMSPTYLSNSIGQFINNDHPDKT